MKLALVALGVVLVCGGASAGGHIEKCAANYETCLDHMMELLLDNEAFWFGNSYSRRCPTPTTSLVNPNADPWCLNPLPQSTNIWDRLFSQQSGLPMADEIRTQHENLKLANVTFHDLWPMEGYACGHQYDMPYMSNVDIDPLGVTRIPQQQIFVTAPHVTWPSTPGAMYSLFIYDIGYSYLHGIYINCMGGNLMTCTEVVPYQGPVNADPIPNPIVFVVAQQENQFDFSEIRSRVGQFRSDETSTFDMTNFVAGLNFSTLWAMSIMNMAGDIFGAQAMSDFGPVNKCPYFASQTEVFQGALIRQADLGDVFSTANNDLPEGHTPFLDSLRVDVKPVYKADDLKFESCCTQYDIPRSMLIPDPFSTKPERPVQTRNKPHVSLSALNKMDMTMIRDTTYMMMLIDFGDLQGSWDGMDKSFMMHWFVSHIKYGDVRYAKEEIKYFGPNPFSRAGPRLYAFLLFEQKDPQFDPASTIMNYADGMCDNWSSSRCKYFIKRMVMDWNLGPIKGATYFWAEQDAFARMRIYDWWAAGSKSFACEGIPGFMEPFCPLKCDDFLDVADHAQLAIANHVFIKAAALFAIVFYFKM